MPEDNTAYEALKRKVTELSDSLDSLVFSFWKKTGSDSNSVQGAKMQSVNFASGSAGWELTPDGNLEANDGNFRGDITGASGTFSGTLTGGSLNIPDTTTANSMHVESDGDTWWGTNVASGHASAPAKILKDGAATFSSVTITGGSIAGTPISSIPNNSSTDISLLEATHDLVFSVTDKDTVAWASGTITLSNGRTFSITGNNTGNMTARTYIYLDTGVSSTALQTTTTVSTAMGANKKLIAVAQNGSAQAQFTVYGGIGGIKLPASGTSISNNNWTYSGTWSVTDADTIAWGAGTLTTSDGGSYSISGSNTGNMAAKTYVYFDLGTSSTAFQTTTTASTAIGDGKILIAICQNGTGEANFIVVNDKQSNIDAAQIVAGSITANEIAAGAVTANKISVSTLSAISADMGTITAGTVTGATLRTSSSNPKFNITSTAFQGIESGGNVTFEVVVSGGNEGDVIMGDDASGSYAMWDDSAGTFNVYADNISIPTVEIFSSSGTWTKPSGLQYATVKAWGGGGSGGSQNDHAATGGGGGCYMEKTFAAASLGSTETVTIGDGGAGVADNNPGNSGGTTTFGSLLTAYGGGAGYVVNNDASDYSYSGGEGGTPFATGAVGITDSTTGQAAVPVMGIWGQRVVGNTGGAGYLSGAGGGATLSTATAGGNAIKGGAGGGGAHNGGTEGAGGTSIDGGNGGAGQYDTNGTAGSVPGGGGGACSSGGTSGAGGKGRVEVWHYY